MSDENNEDLGILFNQDYRLESIILYPASGDALDIKFMVVEFNYYEDIFSNAVTGTILVNDSMGYVNLLSMSGNEYLTLQFSKQTEDSVVRKIFRVFKIANRTKTKYMNESYILHFCSEELILGEQYRISRSYKNQTIDQMIKSICTEYLKVDSTKMTNFEKTKGSKSLIVPNLKPFDAINWLASRAISSNSKAEGSAFIFYENKDGFNFNAITSLFLNPVYRKYTYEVKNYSSENFIKDFSKDVVNVLQYEFVHTFDSLKATYLGTFVNKTISIDPFRRIIRETDFNYDDYFSSGAKLNSNKLINNNINRFGDSITKAAAGVTKFMYSDHAMNESDYIKGKNFTTLENDVEQYVPYRTAQIALINAIKLKLVIPGDPNVKVGMIVQFDLPEMTTHENYEERQLDKYYSGKFLVTAVRHKIDQDNKYVSVVEISKESVNDKFGDFDNKNMAWNSIRIA